MQIQRFLRLGDGPRGEMTLPRKAAGMVVVTIWTALAANPRTTNARTTNAAGPETGVGVTNSHFHTWKAITLRNRTAEIVVVPAIGRVMRFALVDKTGASLPGPFWGHPQIAGGGGGGVGGGGGQHGGGGDGHVDRNNGSGLQPDSEGWTNYGGDKTWPAPQSEWPKITGHGWPPPKAFDAVPFTATVTLKGNQVQLVSAVDPDYGVRVRRTIALDPHKPIMTIETAYEKVRGAPVSVAVWTITQLISPDRLFVRLPPRPSAAFPSGYSSLLPDAPQGLTTEGRLLSMVRDPTHKTMLSSDGHALLWVGDGLDLLIEDATSDDAGTWPNHGARSQVYTSPGPLKGDGSSRNGNGDQPYVELELLGRLHNLVPGGRATMRARYTLTRRIDQDPSREARRLLTGP